MAGQVIQVLHITECYGAGVGKAIDTFTFNSPEQVEHHLLYSGEENPRRNNKFATLRKMVKNQLFRPWQIKKLVKDLEPDLIFAHSSWAGLYVRILPYKVPIIYQPHCYVFEDKSRNPVSRCLYFLVEKLLTHNTDVTVVLSPREQRLATLLNKRQKTLMIPNTNSLEVYSDENSAEITVEAAQTHNSGCPRVAMIGRVSNQKDPVWFTEVAHHYKAKYPHEPVQFIWVGDGDPVARNQLTNCGVLVTGWKTSSEIKEILEHTDIYLHTACYEGFPLAVLDALSLRVPTLVRDIHAFEGTPLKKVLSPEDAADTINGLLKDSSLRLEIISEQSKLLTFMNHNKQEEAILKVFDLVKKN